MAISKYSRQIKPALYTPRSIEEYMLVPKAQTEALLGSQAELGSMLFDKNLLPQDKAKLNEVLDPFNQKIDALSEKLAKGDISPQTLMGVSSLSQEYKKLVSPTGYYGRAAQNYDLAMDYLKNAADTYDQDPMIAQAAAQDYINSFSTFQGEGFANGVNFIGKAMPAFVNTQEYITDIAKNVKADKFAQYLDDEGKRMLQRNPNYRLYDLLGHITTTSRSKILEMIQNTAVSDPDFLKSYNFQMQYQGLPGLVTTTKNAKGEEVAIINPATPFARIAEATARGMSSIEESFKQIKDDDDGDGTGSKVTIPGTSISFGDASLQTLSESTVIRNTGIGVQTAVGTADAALAQLNTTQNVNTLQGALGINTNLFDYETTDANAAIDRDNLLRAYTALNDVLAKDTENIDGALDAFVTAMPTVNEDKLREFIQDENNIQLLQATVETIYNKNLADFNESIFDEDAKGHLEVVKNAFGGEEEFNEKMGLNNNGTPFNRVVRNRLFLNEELSKKEAKIFQDNLVVLHKYGDDAYKAAVVKDYQGLIQEQIQVVSKSENTARSETTAKEYQGYLATEGNVMTNAIIDRANVIIRNYNNEYLKNKKINTETNVQQLSYDVSDDISGVSTIKEAIKTTLLASPQTAMSINGITLQQELASRQFELTKDTMSKFDIVLRPIAGRNYMQLISLEDKISFIIEPNSVESLANNFRKLQELAFSDQDYINYALNEEAGRLFLLNQTLKQKNLIGIYNRLIKPKNITQPVRFVFGQDEHTVEVNKGAGDNYLYTVKAGGTTIGIYNTPSDLFIDLFFNKK